MIPYARPPNASRLPKTACVPTPSGRELRRFAWFEVDLPALTGEDESEEHVFAITPTGVEFDKNVRPYGDVWVYIDTLFLPDGIVFHIYKREFRPKPASVGYNGQFQGQTDIKRGRV